jgi:hypothetical protein
MPTSAAAAGRRRAHRQPELRELEEHPQQDHGEDRDEQDAEILAREGDAPGVVDLVAERSGHELEVGAPDPGDDPVGEDEETDGDDHDGDHRPVLHGADHGELHDDAEHERDRERQRERQPVREAPQRQLVADVGHRHPHLALGEVDHLGRAVDEDERERQAPEDRSLREARHRLLGEDAARERADDQEDRDGDERSNDRKRHAGADGALAPLRDDSELAGEGAHQYPR